jgi:hypothetical protein
MLKAATMATRSSADMREREPVMRSCANKSTVVPTSGLSGWLAPPTPHQRLNTLPRDRKQSRVNLTTLTRYRYSTPRQ